MGSRTWTDIGLPGDASRRVAACEGYKAAVGQLAVHPYNVVDPDRSIWWLFPAGKGRTNWPAYHLGKFIFDKPAGRNAIRAGIHVEKGLGREQARAFGPGKGADFELTSKWLWHSFVQDLTNGALAAAVEDIINRSALGVELDVTVGAPLDEPRLHERYSSYLLRIGAGGRVTTVEASEHRQVLTALRGCQDLPAAGRILAGATDSHTWNWINVVIGCAVPIGSAGPQTSKPWGGQEFWELVLEPLLPWVR